MKKIFLDTLTEDQVKRCKDFSEECVKTNKKEYSRRNQNVLDKLKQDIYFGKVCEFAVYNYLISKGKSLEEPDLKIYENERKSFDEDLKCENAKIHVKSCIFNPQYHVSWVFQPNDPVTIRPSSDDFLALCVISEESYFYMVKPEQVEYEKPLKKSLNKKVIYEKTMIRNSEKQEQA